MTRIADYDFDLPAELVAQHPLADRSDARLMVIDRSEGSISHHHVRDLPELLQPDDCLVVNNSRVIPARLVGCRTRTGGRWQGLVLAVDAGGNWQLMSKTRGRIEAGETVTLQDRDGQPGVRLRMLAPMEGGTWAARPETDEGQGPILARYGRIPIPPYIRGGDMIDRDVEDYQTVYARMDGSVAAPTAGLHFTDKLLEQIGKKGTSIAELTLHVGLGTFRPVACEELEDHAMHSEWGQLSEQALATIRASQQAGGRVVAVGTTSARLLEAASKSGDLASWEGETDIFIAPPYTFRSTDGLMTNFHLPRSTLLVLVRTFGGNELIRRAYAEAIGERYRFYSYGDAMLVL
jgi:S-adenosylmethionine:tRNA ribosyltransferase-isomerase